MAKVSEWNSRLFGTSADSAHAARRFVTEVVEDRADATPSPELLLLTNELVSNAIRHSAGAQFELDVAFEGPVVRVNVSDATRQLFRPAVTQSTGGRGLVLVDRLAEGWGVEHPWGTGKCVWFELRDPTERSAS